MHVSVAGLNWNEKYNLTVQALEKNVVPCPDGNNTRLARLNMKLPPLLNKFAYMINYVVCSNGSLKRLPTA